MREVGVIEDLFLLPKIDSILKDWEQRVVALGLFLARLCCRLYPGMALTLLLAQWRLQPVTAWLPCCQFDASTSRTEILAVSMAQLLRTGTGYNPNLQKLRRGSKAFSSAETIYGSLLSMRGAIWRQGGGLGDQCGVTDRCCLKVD